VSLLLIVPTDTLRHVVLFLHGSFALPLRRRRLMVMRIIFFGLRGVGEILLLIIMLHVVDKITTRILNSLLLLNAHSSELINSSVFRLRVIGNLKSLKFLRQERHD
jgi:hypothetical protein